MKMNSSGEQSPELGKRKYGKRASNKEVLLAFAFLGVFLTAFFYGGFLDPVTPSTPVQKSPPTKTQEPPSGSLGTTANTPDEIDAARGGGMETKTVRIPGSFTNRPIGEAPDPSQIPEEIVDEDGEIRGLAASLENQPEAAVMQAPNRTAELPEDLRRQLQEPPPELPEDLKAQLNAPPPEIPEDIKRALAIPPRIVTLDEVNNPKRQ